MSTKSKTYAQSGKTLTSRFQQEVLALVQSRGVMGVTDGELQHLTGKGHGSTSSALSTLHKRGYLSRLKAKRGKFTIYVYPAYLQGREVHPPYTNKGLLPSDHSVCEATEAVLILEIENLKKELEALRTKARK